MGMSDTVEVGDVVSTMSMKYFCVVTRIEKTGGLTKVWGCWADSLEDLDAGRADGIELFSITVTLVRKGKKGQRHSGKGTGKATSFSSFFQKMEREYNLSKT